MKYVQAKGLNLSAFSLGTVQLGMNYGINNKDGKPSREKAFAILDTAMEQGVTSLDTADDYGDSEVVIGEWLKTRAGKTMPLITTKIARLDHTNIDTLRASIRERVESCKERLGLKVIPVLMLHDFEDYNCDRENIKTIFAELKASGDIMYSGISAYSRHDYGVLAESGVDAVQIPMNIFDWGQIDNGGIEKLRKAGMMIFIRSVFLQGLVFQDPDNLDPRMEFAADTLRKFRGFCKKFDLTPATLAMSFLLSLEGITCLVLGCEKPEQVADNAKLIDGTIKLSPEQLEELHQAFKDTDQHILNPGTWFNA